MFIIQKSIIYISNSINQSIRENHTPLEALDYIIRYYI
ncbi:unnamed protein product [Paramecium octaurelia]|uniref:Uncharacterized protein n=1 Tax=Paramecium octaurelia TaxID=43137 RepID=A0A8S1SGU2_PAROT|nr:unnamed protein product [Paramecium octaurelia]